MVTPISKFEVGRNIPNPRIGACVLTYSNLALKLFCLAVQVTGALPSNNREEVLCKFI